MDKLSPRRILYEDNHLLVVDKPPGLATMGLPEGQTTLLTLAKDYIKQKYEKKGNVYLGVVSRLDVPVSGVVVFARTSKAADRLNEQFRNHSTLKTYRAIVEGLVFPLEDDCVDFICEDQSNRKIWITKNAKAIGAKEARLHYRRLERLGTNSLLEIRLETGRKHQIRLQLSHRGFPILGDRKYGSNVFLPDGTGITLHAQSLTIRHPTTGSETTFEAPVPRFWNAFMK